MGKEMKKKDFTCPYGDPFDGGADTKGYTMTCHYFGCLHQINDDCPIIKEAINECREDV